MNPVKRFIEDQVCNLSPQAGVGFAMPTNKAVDAIDSLLSDVWASLPKPSITTAFKGDISLNWSEGTKSFLLSSSEIGEISYWWGFFQGDKWYSKEGDSIAPNDVMGLVYWVKDIQDVKRSTPAAAHPTAAHPPVRDRLIDAVLPPWARTVRRAISFGSGVVGRQIARIDPSTIDRAASSIRGRIEACRRIWGDNG